MFTAEITKDVRVVGISQNITPLTIVGTKPLLVNRQPYQPVGFKAPKLSDDEAYHAALYRMNGENHFGFPASGVKGSAVSAGRFISSLSMVEIKGLFFVRPGEDGLLSILTPDGTGFSQPVIDRQMVKKKDGNSIPVVRARFDEWRVDFDVIYQPSMITIESIIDIYQIAGLMVGLGCRRPERSGLQDWGTYQIEQ